MNKKLITLAIAAAVAAPLAAQAGSITVPNMDITMSGGITGAYLYQTDTKKDAFVVQDALLDFASEAKAGGMGFDLGVGTLAGNSLLTPMTVIGSGGSVGVQYGYVTVMPTDSIKVDAGLLATNIGYEVVPSYGNASILHGFVWSAEPAYYTGARATYSMGNMSVYAEANKNATSAGAPGSGIGASGSFGGANVALNFMSFAEAQTGPGSIVDIIASTKAGNVTLAANIDYLAKSDRSKKASTGTDDNAYGVALYASMPMGDKAELPIRFEYINDGTSNLYGLNPGGVGGTTVSKSAMSFTISPTYNFTNATFARAELAYVNTDKKTLYVDDKGALTDSNLTVGFQGGVRF
jgi:hypothetical protein